MSDNMELHDVLAEVSLKFRKDLKIVHINAQSLVDSSHFTEFCYLFNDTYFDIISVSETFFKPNVPDSAVHLPGYNLFRVDRTGRGCGGVAVYVKEHIKCAVLCSSPNEYTKSPEYIMLELTLRETKILLVSIYRPPKVGHMEKVLEDIHAYIFSYKYIFFVGDVNARFGSGTFETENLCDLLSSCNLECIPFNNTYRTAACESNLDIIASNCHDLLIHFGQQSAPCFSNHDLLFGVYSLATPKYFQKQYAIRDFKHFDLSRFTADAVTAPWNNIYHMDNIDDKVTFFSEQVLALYDKHAPMKIVTAKNRPVPWMTSQIRNLIKKRDSARRKYNKTRDPEDYEVFRRKRNHTKQMIRNVKIKYIHGLFANCRNSSECWKAAKTLGVGSSKLQSNSYELPMTADELNQHFIASGESQDIDRIHNSIQHYYSLPARVKEKFYFEYVHPETIVKAISSIRTQAKGPDNIPIFFINKCLHVFLPSLEHIYNFSLQNSIFPSEWKLSNVKPIPKIPRPLSCHNVRPINLVCALSKGLEKIIYDQVYSFIEQHHIINTYQSGFKKGHSTVTALLRVTDDIRLAIDERKLTLLCLFDFSKAFDSVHHELLLSKLHYIGFSMSTILWFKSYLRDRYQRVLHNDGSCSEWALASNGVPQGSVLGPLLFLLYTFDIFTVFHNTRYHMFADDLQAYVHFPAQSILSAVHNMNADIDRLVQWAADHNLTINSSKTQLILIGHPRLLNCIEVNNIPPVLVNDMVIQYKTKVKNLGMVVDSTMSWTDHINLAINKAVSVLQQLRRNISYMPRNIRKLLVQSLVIPVLEYGSIVYNDLAEILNIKIQRIQNACVRFILDVRREEHITPYFIQLQWLKLKDRRTIAIATLTLNILRNKTPAYLYEGFCRMDNIHSRCNRFSQYTMQIPKHRTTKYNKSFICSASRIYNIHELHNFLNATSRKLRSHLTRVLLSDYE